MKKSLLFIITLVTISTGIAQTWCPPGARWHFKRGWPYSVSGVDGIIEMVYTTTTTVANTPCKRLDATFSGRRLIGPNPSTNIIAEPYGTYYTYDNNNVIFIYNGANAFDTLVDFNALIGSTWLMPRSSPNNCDFRPKITVTDTGHVIINGFNLRTITTSYTAQVTTFNGTFTYTAGDMFAERILLLYNVSQNLFPTNCEGTNIISEIPSNMFRCYEDANFPLHNTWGNFGCNSLTGIETLQAGNSSINIYPNPSNGYLTLELSEPTRVDVLNGLGASVHVTRFENSGPNELDVSDLPPGVYYLQIQSASGKGYSKFIRQ